MNDAPMYVNVYNAKFLGNVFDYQTDDINIIKAFVNLNAKVSDRVALMAGVLFRSADSDKFADALYVPMIESSIAVKYSSEKFNTQVKCDFVGEQYFCDQIATSPEILNQIVKADGYADLKFECNYKFNKQITFGVMVDNILNSNIYKFNHYRQLGTSVMAKVNLKF
jgi:outer membrane receptor for ferrienterochelin and colicin